MKTKLLAIFGTAFCFSCVNIEINMPLFGTRLCIEISEKSNTREQVSDLIFKEVSQLHPALTPDNTSLFIRNVPLSQAKYPLSTCSVNVVPIEFMLLNEKTLVLPIEQDPDGYLWTVYFHNRFSDSKTINNSESINDFINRLGQDCNLSRLLNSGASLDMFSYWTYKIIISNGVDTYCMIPDPERSTTISLAFWDPQKQSISHSKSRLQLQRKITELVANGYEEPEIMEFYASARPMFVRVLELICSGHKLTQNGLDNDSVQARQNPLYEHFDEGKQAWVLQ